MMSRRQLLLAASTSLAGIATLRFGMATPGDVIAAVVRKRLDYLKLEPNGVETFARDLAGRGLIATGKLRAFSAVGLTELSVEIVGKDPGTLRHGEERIVTYYLLSSDFFLMGANEKREVHYLGFYDPFRFACMNPFPASESDVDLESV